LQPSPTDLTAWTTAFPTTDSTNFPTIKFGLYGADLTDFNAKAATLPGYDKTFYDKYSGWAVGIQTTIKANAVKPESCTEPCKFGLVLAFASTKEVVAIGPGDPALTPLPAHNIQTWKRLATSNINADETPEPIPNAANPFMLAWDPFLGYCGPTTLASASDATT